MLLVEIAAIAFVDDARRHQLLLGVRTLLEFRMRVQVAEFLESRRLLHYRSVLALATFNSFAVLPMYLDHLLLASEL